jgi:hypothetical protein
MHHQRRPGRTRPQLRRDSRHNSTARTQVKSRASYLTHTSPALERLAYICRPSVFTWSSQPLAANHPCLHRRWGAPRCVPVTAGHAHRFAKHPPGARRGVHRGRAGAHCAIVGRDAPPVPSAALGWLDEEGEINGTPMAKMRPQKIPEKPAPVLPERMCGACWRTARARTSVIGGIWRSSGLFLDTHPGGGTSETPSGSAAITIQPVLRRFPISPPPSAAASLGGFGIGWSASFPISRYSRMRCR